VVGRSGRITTPQGECRRQGTISDHNSALTRARVPQTRVFGLGLLTKKFQTIHHRHPKVEQDYGYPSLFSFLRVSELFCAATTAKPSNSSNKDKA